jgi:hypothetical protein
MSGFEAGGIVLRLGALMINGIRSFEASVLGRARGDKALKLELFQLRTELVIFAENVHHLLILLGLPLPSVAREQESQVLIPLIYQQMRIPKDILQD